jgi:adenylate cyclase
VHPVAGLPKKPDSACRDARGARDASGAVVALESVSRSDDFAERLSLALRAANLSGSQLAAAVGVDKSVVSRWLSGHAQPTSYNLARISAAIAKISPGFNMILWTAPRAEFEAAIGLGIPSGSAAAEAVAVPDSASRVTRSTPHLSVWTAVAGIVLLLLIGIEIWAASGTIRDPAPAAPIAAKASPASIAVMPFVNMSGDPAKEYLGDGISEEILNDFANTPGLHVAARTSSFSFKGKNADIGEIARKLHVGTILEGSVRQEGNRIRVVAQLIDAADGFHLWSARYDRKLDDILAMQDEISHAIASTLGQKLAARTERPRKIDSVAYQQYLQARYFFNLRDPAAWAHADNLLKDAIARQPDFAAAYALRAHVIMASANDFSRRSVTRQLTAMALSLDPDNREALFTDLQLSLGDFDWLAAYRKAHRLLAMKYHDALTYQSLASYYFEMGFPKQSLDAARRAVELDPLNFAYLTNYADWLGYAGRTGDAIAAAKAALELQPNHPLALYALCTLSAGAVKMEQARTYFRQLDARREYFQQLAMQQDRHRSPMLRGCEIAIALKTQSASQVHALLDRTKTEFPFARERLATAYWRTGDSVEAFELLSEAYDKRFIRAILAMPYDSDAPKALLRDPRWNALWQRPYFRGWQQVHDRIAADLASNDGGALSRH